MTAEEGRGAPTVETTNPALRKHKVTIEQELRKLRRLDGPLTEAKLTSTPLLTRAIGGGNSAVTLEKLRQTAAIHSDDRDISIAFAALGIEGSRGNVLDTLTEIGSGEGVDARTIRRWSDDGIKKLAGMIVGTSFWLNPWLSALLEEREPGKVLLSVWLQLHTGLDMKFPQATLNGVSFELNPVLVTKNGNSSGTYKCSEAEVPYRDGLVALEGEIAWRGNVTPTFELNSKVTGPGIWIRSFVRFSKLQICAIRSETPPVGNVEYIMKKSSGGAMNLLYEASPDSSPPRQS